MAARLPAWETRLSDYFEGAFADACAGKANYCALFAAGAVEAVTGENLAARYRGKYAETADRLEAAIDECLPPRLVAFARRGDLVWHEGAVGVVIGADALFTGARPDGECDLVRVPRSGWEKAWSVGDG